MSRMFSVPKVLRMLPKAYLPEFLARLNCQLHYFDWRKYKSRQPQALLLAVQIFLPDQLPLIEQELGRIYQLACVEGTKAILEVARCQGMPLTEFPSQACVATRALWTWLHAPQVFEEALWIQRIQDLTYWRKRTGLPSAQPQINPVTICRLEQALSELLKREEGRGQHCTIEYFRRENGTDYFVAYTDDFWQTWQVHDEQGKLSCRSLQPTFEIVFAYHGDQNALELYAQVDRRLKPQLENLFAETILGLNLWDYPETISFNLNRFKDQQFALETDPQDQVEATLQRLRFELPNKARVTVERGARTHAQGLQELVEECLEDQQLVIADAHISAATIRLEIAARPGRRGGCLTLDVTYPNCCSIKTRRPEWISLSRKYLRRWRIACG